jgi:cysteine desulfurase family protein (TIGR01976 family)
MPLDLNRIRAHFPALSLSDHGLPRVYLDNPGGTQVPQSVIDRMTHYLIHTNANKDGEFRTARESDQVLHEAHAAMADLLNAASPDEIIFGPNMTTLTFAISRALGRLLQPGDEIIVTRLDHDADIAPWLLLAEDRGAVVKWVDIRTEDCTLDMSDFESQITDKTRIVACGYASNAVGTINDVKAVVDMAHAVGALVYVDAVQYVPHGPTDVQALGCDLLACSPYKFFGPHMGAVYGRYDLLNRLRAYKVRPAHDEPPYKFETGTQNHEGIAGTLAAVEYLAWLGEEFGAEYSAGFGGFSGRRLHTHTGLAAMAAYERELSRRLISGLSAVPGLQIRGITDLDKLDRRVPTVSFTLAGWRPRDIAARLGEQNIFVWDGHYYAVAVVERLGLMEKGGMVRVGAAHYNTVDEIDKLVEAVKSLAH